MTESNLSIHMLAEDIKSEFEVDEQGRVFAKSVRAIARLAHTTPSNLLHDRDRETGLFAKLLMGKGLSKPLEPFAGFDYRVVGKVPDLLVAAIIKHYAYYAKNTNEVAKDNDMAMSAIGVRTWFQQQLGWKPPVKDHSKRIKKYQKEGKDDAWIQERVEGIDTRKPFVDEQFNHGASRKGVAKSSDLINVYITGESAASLKQTRAVKQTRDGLTRFELMSAKFAEELSTKRLQKFNPDGDKQILGQVEQAAIGVRMLMDDCS